MRINFFAAAVMTATTLFASCNRDKDDKNPNAGEGKPTTITVSFTFPRSAQTRATADPNASAEEAMVNTVDVFIYTETGYFLSHTHLVAADLDQTTPTANADVYVVRERIQTTTGAKSVYAGVNLPSSIVSAIIDQPAGTLATVVRDVTSNMASVADMNFTMFCTEGVNRTFVDNSSAPANQVTLQCQRLVAKITVELDGAASILGADAMLANLSFAVNNYNKKIFLLQGDAPYRKDPNWAISGYLSGDFGTTLPGDYLRIKNSKPHDSPTPYPVLHPFYAAENSSEGKRKKEITRVTVRGAFVPFNICEDIVVNSFGITDKSAVLTPRTIWMVTKSVALDIGSASAPYFFDNYSSVERFRVKHSLLPGEIIEYTDGFCYWDIFLNKTPADTENKWDVLRNDYYKCNITKILVPGRNVSEVPDPEETPDNSADITVTIEILFWNLVSSNYELE